MAEHDDSSLPRSRTAAIAAFSLTLLAVLYPLSRWDYLLFHSLTEAFSTFVAVGIFVIAWNTRKTSENGYLTVLGCGLLFTGLTTLLHMFAYKGMGVFPEGGTNLPTQLWIISRLFAAASFLVAGVSFRRWVRLRVTITGFGLAWLVAMASVFVWPVFPVMYANGGLTALKVGLEYAIIAMFTVSGWLLWSSRRAFDAAVLRMLLAAIGLMVAAELAFTLYTDVYGLLNLAGHYFVVVGSALIYLALIDTALTRPYALLFRELHRREREEHRIADVLQSALLCAPDRIDSVAVGYAHRSATSGALVGGDFYDLFVPSPGVVAFLVGDVCGKGVEAAAATAMVRATMRTFAFEDPAPASVLRRTNEVVRREFADDKFVTVIYGVIDTATGAVRVAAAGHPDPVLRDAAGTHVLSIPRNPPLGVMFDQRHAEERVILDAGDLLVLYTDGLLDAGWERGAFGVDRVLEGVREGYDDPFLVASSLLDQAVDFALGALSDDVAVVALRFLPPPAVHAETRAP